MGYPVSYRTQYVEQRSRLRVFFRWALAIPVMLAAALWAVVGFFTIVAAWFMLLFTAKYPPGLYELNANILRALSRFTGFLYLQTDRFPPLGLTNDPDYPIQVVIAPAQERYSRLKIFFRMLLALPLYFVSAAFGYANGAVVVAAWFVIVILGRLPEGMHSAIDFLYGFTVRYYGYAFGMFTDRYPGFSDDWAEQEQLPPAQPIWSPPVGYQSPYGQPQYPAQPGYPPTPEPPQAPPAAPYGGPPPPE